MAHSTPVHRGNSSMAHSAPTPRGTPSTSGNCGIHHPVLQARGLAYSTPSNSQMLRATSQVDKFQLKVEDYDKIVQYLEIPENFALLHSAGKKTRYKREYKEARNLSTSTGAGLTEEELELGISLEDKLNKVCPHFDRMHLLLGGHPNVNPRGTADFGIDNDEFITHGDSDDEEDPTVPAYFTASPPLPATPTVILTYGHAQVFDREPARTEELYEEDIIEMARRTLAEDLEREAAEMEESESNHAHTPPCLQPRLGPHVCKLQASHRTKTSL
ncbi:unnamed protein product [Calypogeia fissa]